MQSETELCGRDGVRFSPRMPRSILLFQRDAACTLGPGVCLVLGGFACVAPDPRFLGDDGSRPTSVSSAGGEGTIADAGVEVGAGNGSAGGSAADATTQSTTPGDDSQGSMTAGSGGTDPTASSSSSSDATGMGAVCGDGELSAGESCEPAEPAGGRGPLLGDQSCASLGFDLGTLDCSPACEFDTTHCQRCGDGVRQGFEECDGSDLATRGCADFVSEHGIAYDAGSLACSAQCQFELAGCSACGNAVRESAEVCDADDLGGERCTTRGFSAGRLACAADCLGFDASACTQCGDGNAQGDEACDGVDLQGASCASVLGSGSGTLACDSSCRFDTSNCSSDACGDGTVNGSDQCDCGDADSCSVAQLDNQGCADQGFDGGTLDCQSPSSCLFDTSGCYRCGDGEINPGEQCDGAALGAASCQTLGFTSGELSCDDACAYDSSACSGVKSYRVCSNGSVGIPALSSVATNLFVDLQGTIVRMSVELQISHVWVAGLYIELWQTLRQDLIDRPGKPAQLYGCRQPDIDVVLEDEAMVAAEDLCSFPGPAVSGSARPIEAFDLFEGSNMFGLWTLTAADDMNAAGTLQRWCLNFDYQ